MLKGKKKREKTKAQNNLLGYGHKAVSLGMISKPMLGFENAKKLWLCCGNYASNLEIKMLNLMTCFFKNIKDWRYIM